jgi:nitric oxide reductase large subunit
MPFESRLFVKTSLVALTLAFAAGAALAVAESLGIVVNPIWSIEHAHLAFVGWLVNLVIGIALWMLPLARDRYPETAGRYPKRGPLIVYVLLNGGLVLRIGSEPMLRFGLLPHVALWVSAVAQFAGIATFALIAWHRVRAPSRPAPGVR